MQFAFYSGQGEALFCLAPTFALVQICDTVWYVRLDAAHDKKLGGTCLRCPPGSNAYAFYNARPNQIAGF